MREIIEKRRPHCKVFDLGGRKRKVVVSLAPLHYRCDGKWEDIDTTPRLAGKLLEVTEAPYRLKIDPDRPAYLYTNESGRQVEVELIEVGGQPVKVGRSSQEAGTVRWQGVAPQTDVAFRPLRKGIEALVILYGPEAPKTWRWRIRGDQDLMLPPKGHDAKGQRLELQHSYDGDVLTITWTGRVTSRERLRRKAGFIESAVYPVVIDPTVNESVSAGADDAMSVWVNNGATFSYFTNARQEIYVGLYGGFLVYGGVRFQSVPVPQGATISSATLTVDILFITGSPNANVYGDDVDSAPVWSDPGSRVKEITKTTAVTNITPSSEGLYPISITGIVQELVDRAGWASGNHMRFGFFNNAQSNNVLVFAAFEHATRTEAQLEIEYEEAAAARVAPKMMHYMRLHNG